MPYADPAKTVEALKKSTLKYRLAHPEKIREQQRRKNKKWLARVKAFAEEHGITWRQAIQALRGRRNQKDGAGVRNAYGQTSNDYSAMVAAHDGRCALCNEAEPLKLDHEHVVGWKTMPGPERAKHIRGMLCHACNTFIGYCREDVDVILRKTQHIAANVSTYLRRKP